MPLVDIIGELDLNSTLGQLATARYSPETSGRAASNVSSRQGAETLSVVTTLPEVRAAVKEPNLRVVSPTVVVVADLKGLVEVANQVDEEPQREAPVLARPVRVLEAIDS